MTKLTAFIKFSNPNCFAAIRFKELINTFGFSITQGKADLVIMDYLTWRNVSKVFFEDSLIVVTYSSITLYNYQYVDVRREVPKDVMLIQEPIDYEFHMSNILDRLNYWDKNE